VGQGLSKHQEQRTLQPHEQVRQHQSRVHQILLQAIRQRANPMQQQQPKQMNQGQSQVLQSQLFEYAK